MGTGVSAKDRAAISLAWFCTSVNLNVELARTLAFNILRPKTEAESVT